MSKRQVGRLCQRVREGGNREIIHGLRGRLFKDLLPEELIERAKAIVRENYVDFGPTFVSEKLAENEGIGISVRSLQQAIIKAGI